MWCVRAPLITQGMMTQSELQKKELKLENRNLEDYMLCLKTETKQKNSQHQRSRPPNQPPPVCFAVVATSNAVADITPSKMRDANEW